MIYDKFKAFVLKKIAIKWSTIGLLKTTIIPDKKTCFV